MKLARQIYFAIFKSYAGGVGTLQFRDGQLLFSIAIVLECTYVMHAKTEIK